MDDISITMEEGLAPDDVQPPLSDWGVSIREKVRKAREAERPDAWADVCIYRVPKALRDVNPRAFDQQIVSIGPYHHGKEGLRDMDIHKWRCFCRIIDRSKLDEVILFNSIREVVSEARGCYEGTIELSDVEFVETMVLDGCFLLEIFWGYDKGFESLGYSSNDPMFSFRRALDFIGQDVKRLENQVPLFILERLLGLITNEMKDKDEVVRLALNCFRVTTPNLDPYPEINYRHCVHCLDIYRQSLLFDEYEITSFPRRPIPEQIRSKFKKLLHLITPPCYRNTSDLDSPNRPPMEQLTIPCVTKLRESGIEFKKRETKRRGYFLDIKFEAEAGVLHIPMLVLGDNISREFPNLIAFEQCHSDCSYHVTSYAKFMDDLIDSPDDVAFLHDRGIIDPFGVGSYKETANFFNSIGKELAFTSYTSYLSRVTTDLSKEVKKYNESTIRNLTVKIKGRYFSNPWSPISLFAAIFLLVLTFLATFYAMYGYYKPRSHVT